MRFLGSIPLPEPGSYVNLWERIPHDTKERTPGGCNQCHSYVTFEQDESEEWFVMTYHSAKCPAYTLSGS